MNTIKMKYLIFYLIGLTVTLNLNAQPQLSTYLDAGGNKASDGLYIRTSAFGAWNFDKTKADVGIQFDLKNSSSKVFTGAVLNIARELSIKEFRFEVQGFFLYNPFSHLVHESNWGMLLNTERKHFTYKLGTEFRTYHLTQDAIEKYDIGLNKNLHENWNLIYLLGYKLKPTDNKWNIGISITNFDHFIINQENNPLIFVRGSYKVSSPLTLYAEAWYKSAGTFNIYTDYFGILFRTGLIWKLQLTK
jgi:hypothetical protein